MFIPFYGSGVDGRGRQRTLGRVGTRGIISGPFGGKVSSFGLGDRRRGSGYRGRDPDYMGVGSRVHSRTGIMYFGVTRDGGNGGDGVGRVIFRWGLFSCIFRRKVPRSRDVWGGDIMPGDVTNFTLYGYGGGRGKGHNYGTWARGLD